jgi:hypothetical protein
VTPDLEGEFHRKMLDTYDEAAKFGYRPTYFLRLVQEQGGLRAAKTPLRKGVSDGLTRLAKEGRLDISMEHLVLTPPFDQLFSEEEKELARWALKNAQNL